MRTHLRALDSSLVGTSRKRTSSMVRAGDSSCTTLSALRNAAQATARGRRMLGACGALLGYTFEISRKPKVTHRAVEGLSSLTIGDISLLSLCQ